MATMVLRWTTANPSDPSLSGFDGDYLVGQVVHYDEPDAWSGFIHGNRVPGGPWSSAERACAAVDAAWDSRQAGGATA